MPRSRISTVNANGLLQVDAAYDCSLRPSLQTVCFRSTLRRIILRYLPVPRWKWAKPREIRRGTRIAEHIRCRNGVLNNINTLTPILLFGETRATRPTGPPLQRFSGHRHSSTKINYFSPVQPQYAYSPWAAHPVVVNGYLARFGFCHLQNASEEHRRSDLPYFPE